jgi:hypothetical protein
VLVHLLYTKSRVIGRETVPESRDTLGTEPVHTERKRGRGKKGRKMKRTKGKIQIK